MEIPWSDFLKGQFIKLVGPSLGVCRMWTKRNDHAPKIECADFFNIYSKRIVLNFKLKFDFSLNF